MPENPTTPNHIGFIVDGNRRWAKERGKPAMFGHKQGAENLKEVAKQCFEKGVYCVTAYIFSTENWKRSQEEVNFLMDLAVDLVGRYVDDLHEKGVKVVQVGSRDNLSQRVLDAIDRAEEQTKNNTKHILGLCFNYGGQQEITDAVKAFVASGRDASELNPEVFSEYMYAPEIPMIDYVIRTSGEQRLSNFMLWRAAYAEFYFPDTFWPDFKEEELDRALDEFTRRQRRFGG